MLSEAFLVTVPTYPPQSPSLQQQLETQYLVHLTHCKHRDRVLERRVRVQSDLPMSLVSHRPASAPPHQMTVAQTPQVPDVSAPSEGRPQLTLSHVYTLGHCCVQPWC